MSSPTPHLPPKPGRPAGFPKPAPGKSVRGPFQKEAQDTGNVFDSNIVRVIKKYTEPGYKDPEVGSKHPDTQKYPNHKLIMPPIPMEDGETVEFLYAVLKSSIDFGLTEEYGGGKTNTKHEFAFESLPAEEGLLVLASEVEDLNDGRSSRRTTKRDGTEWPTLISYETDPHTGIIVKVTKKVVDATSVEVPFPRDGHKYVDDRAIDEWRTLRIISEVDPDTLPADIVWNGFYEIDLPATLLSVGADWENTGGSSASASVGLAGGPSSTVEVINNGGSPLTLTPAGAGGSIITTVSTNDGVDGNISFQVRHGYRGPAFAEFTERYTMGPPDPDTLPEVTVIQPVSGTASIISKTASFSKAKGTGRVALSNQGKMATKNIAFGPFLSGGVSVADITHTGSGSGAEASGTPDINGDSFDTTLEQGGSTSTMKIHIPVSIPESLTPGDWIYKVVHPERWRFDVWVTTIVRVKIPTPPGP